MKDTKQILKRYVITVAAASASTALIMYLKGIATAESHSEALKIITDAFTVPGIVLMMIAALVWVSRDGFFDGIGYAASRVGNMFLPLVGAVNTHESYVDYKERKSKNRAEDFLFLLFVGIGFFLIAMVFYAIYKFTA